MGDKGSSRDAGTVASSPADCESPRPEIHVTERDDRLDWNDWYRQSGKRWPMTIGIWLGLAFAIYSTAVGYGYRLAQERLPVTRAAVIARNQPPVPDERNAAVLYDQATTLLVPWTKLDDQPPPATYDEQKQRKPRDPDLLNKEDWRREATFAADGPLRTFVRANENAARMALDAAARPEVDWGIPAEDFPKASMKRLTNLHPITRLLSQRALVAAHDGDWPTALVHVRAIERGADHVRRAVGVMARLIGNSLSAQTWTTACYCLALPGATLNEKTLMSFRTLSVDGAQSHLTDLYRTSLDESLICGHVLDQVGCGDFRRFSDRIDKDSMSQLPLPVSIYSAVYPWDRSAFDDLMQGQQDDLLAKSQNRIPERLAPDMEQAFFTDPRLVYANLFARSVSGMVMPMFSMIINMEQERQDKWRMFTAAIDLRLWIHRNHRIPMTLDETGIDPVFLQDPFAKDQRLHLRRDDDGLLRLWSVGRNHKDDTTTPPTNRNDKSDDVTIFIRPPEGMP